MRKQLEDDTIKNLDIKTARLSGILLTTLLERLTCLNIRLTSLSRLNRLPSLDWLTTLLNWLLTPLRHRLTPLRHRLAPLLLELLPPLWQWLASLLCWLLARSQLGISWLT